MNESQTKMEFWNSVLSAEIADFSQFFLTELLFQIYLIIKLFDFKKSYNCDFWDENQSFATVCVLDKAAYVIYHFLFRIPPPN